MGEINKEYKVVISERATDILIEDIRFLSAVNLQAANNLRVEMMEFTELLRYFLSETHSFMILYFQQINTES